MREPYHFVPEALDALDKRIISRLRNTDDPALSKTLAYLEAFHSLAQTAQAFWIQPEVYPLIFHTHLSDESMLESVQLPASHIVIEYEYDYSLDPFPIQDEKERATKRVILLSDAYGKVTVASMYYSEREKHWQLGPIVLGFERDHFFKPWEWCSEKVVSRGTIYGFNITDKINVGTYVPIQFLGAEKQYEELTCETLYEAHFALRFLAILSCHGVECGEIKPPQKKNSLRRHLKKTLIPSYRYIHLAKRDRAEKGPSEPTGKTVSAHYRRGHVRNQAHGPRHSLRKRIWIPPSIVGSGVPQQPKPTQVKL